MADGPVLVSTHRLEAAGRIRDAFQRGGYQTRLVADPEDVEAASDAVLLVLSGGLGSVRSRELADHARRHDLPVFGVSGDADGRGAGDPGVPLDEVFPFPPDPDDLLLLARKAIHRRELRERTGIVGDTDAMVGVLDRISQIAQVDSTVLITGESGTGKELVARGVHHLSPRRHNSFIAVNVAALSEGLLESELFGHEKGAFTGAIDSRRGFFELARKGTIFLDEIGEMPLATQTKLLRVLEQKEFLRVGGESPIRVDVRIIAATNQDLRRMVAMGEFRRDLYFRLNILNVELPPLRERREDIPRLAREFVKELNERMGHDFPGISPEAMGILMAYDWPGNVRELRNLVESMVVLRPGRMIGPDDIPDEVRRGTGGSLLPATVSTGRALRRTRDRGEEPSEGLRPELEFVFRTLVDLRMDMNELRSEFESYRERLETMEEDTATRLEAPVVRFVGGGKGTGEAAEVEPISPPQAGADPRGREGGEEIEDAELADARRPEGDGADGAVLYRPGMTMEDVEREAIQAVLGEVGGNRRKAAERLGIGERTLYRKIRKYGLGT